MRCAYDSDIQNTAEVSQAYMTDLKRALTGLSILPAPLSPPQKSRQASLAAAITSLLQSFPELGTPGSPGDYVITSSNSDIFMSSPGSTSTSFFIPPSKAEAFARLSIRAKEVGSRSKARDLLQRCRDIWGIASRKEKEQELESMIPQWTKSIGSREEPEWARIIAEGVQDLCFGLSKGDQLPSVLAEILDILLKMLSTAITSIFPITSLPSPAPPSSLSIILGAAPSVMLTRIQAVQTLAELTDELKAAAVGEYVVAVGQMMGGVGQDGQAIRKIGQSGKDQMIEGFEDVAIWMEKSIVNVRKSWGDGLGS